VEHGERTSGETRQEEGAANSSRWENGRVLTADPEELRRVVMEEAHYLDKLARRIEALVESQARLSRRIEIYIKALGILPSIGRGIAGGFGIFLGATLVASLFVLILTKWEAVPVIGEFVKRVLDYIEHSP